MNTAEKELFNYIQGTERMSGADSYEDDVMSYFDDSSSFDGNNFSYAGGNNASMPQSDPYILSYQNTTASDVTAILFGYNDYSIATNYGNPTAVVITNLQGGTYARLLTQSNNKPFKISRWRLQSSSSSQLSKTFTINHVDGNGKQYSLPLNLSVARDAYQQQSDVLDVNKAVTVDGNTYITFTLVASQTLVIAMYPTSIISPKAEINGGQFLNNAIAPRLSGKNAAPVIIQTTQAVKGITS
jgi:hypothetical protein